MDNIFYPLKKGSNPSRRSYPVPTNVSSGETNKPAWLVSTNAAQGIGIRADLNNVVSTRTTPLNYSSGELKDDRNLVVCRNTLSGVGKKRSQFNVDADGITTCHYYMGDKDAPAASWTWTPAAGTVAPFGAWRAITSNADGTTLAAAFWNMTPLLAHSYAGLFANTTSGVGAWTKFTFNGSDPGDVPNFSSITSDSTGQYLAAVSGQGDTYWTSHDGGVHWVEGFLPISGDWKITSNSSGTKLAVCCCCVVGSNIWHKTGDGPWEMSETALTSGLDWYSITSSSSGEKLAAVVVMGDIWTSTDGGVHWTKSITPGTGGQAWQSITSDSTGQYLAASSNNAISGVEGDGGIWTSTDGGHIWTKRKTLKTDAADTSVEWLCITSDSTGQYLAAVGAEIRCVFGPGVANCFQVGGNIWTSTDGGANWTKSTPLSAAAQNWVSVASDSTGTKLAAVSSGACDGDIGCSAPCFDDPCAGGGNIWTGVLHN